MIFDYKLVYLSSPKEKRLKLLKLLTYDKMQKRRTNVEARGLPRSAQSITPLNETITL